jgi:hypothetical protein
MMRRQGGPARRRCAAMRRAAARNGPPLETPRTRRGPVLLGAMRGFAAKVWAAVGDGVLARPGAAWGDEGVRREGLGCLGR